MTSGYVWLLILVVVLGGLGGVLGIRLSHWLFQFFPKHLQPQHQPSRTGVPLDARPSNPTLPLSETTGTTRHAPRA